MGHGTIRRFAVRRLFLPASIHSFAADLNSGQRDRARLKERDENNVRFKQSMTPHVSREGRLGFWNWTQMEMQADLFLIWLALIVVWELRRSSPRAGDGATADRARRWSMRRDVLSVTVQARPPRAAARQPG